MKIHLRYLLFVFALISGAANSREAVNTDATVLRTIATALALSPEKLKIDQPFSKQVTPGDALDIVEIVMAIEDALHIAIDDAALDKKTGSKGISELPAKLTIKDLQQVVRESYMRTYRPVPSAEKQKKR